MVLVLEAVSVTCTYVSSSIDMTAQGFLLHFNVDKLSYSTLENDRPVKTDKVH
jgi:hypothetical protein